MAVKLVFSRSCLKVNNEAKNVYILNGLDIKHFPSRNSGLPRKYDEELHVSPSLKCATAISVTRLSMSAGFLALLAGDVSLNPGPMKNSAIVCPGCSKVIRRNQPGLFCKLCELNYHSKYPGSDFEVSDCCPQCSVYYLQTTSLIPKNSIFLQSWIKFWSSVVLKSSTRTYMQNLRRKIDNLRVLFRKPNCSAHLLALTETWAKEDITR